MYSEYRFFSTYVWNKLYCNESILPSSYWISFIFTNKLIHPVKRNFGALHLSSTGLNSGTAGVMPGH